MTKEIKVFYTDGTVESYCGDILISKENGIANIFPQSERFSVKIPIAQIKKYEIR